MRDAALELSRQMDEGRASLVSRILTALFLAPVRALRRRASLRHLAAMTDGGLRDIGLVRSDLDLMARGGLSITELERMRTERWLR